MFYMFSSSPILGADKQVDHFNDTMSPGRILGAVVKQVKHVLVLLISVVSFCVRKCALCR